MAIKEIPSNLIAEQSVLGYMFLSTYALQKACDELQPESFYYDNNKKIFAVFQELHSKGIPLDATTVTTELKNKNILKEVGGLDYLTEIFNIEEDEGYVLTAYGETSKGLLISVSQEIFVQFSRPSSFSALILDNMYDRGNIRLISNIKGLQGQVTGEEIYIGNEKIDLSLEGNEVLFDRGFIIKNDFYLKIYVENLQPNTKKPFLEIFQNEDYLKFYWREGAYRMYNNEPKDYIEMVQEYGTEYETYGKFRYIIQSNFIDPPQPTDKIFVGIKRINGYLQIKIENKGDA